MARSEGGTGESPQERNVSSALGSKFAFVIGEVGEEDVEEDAGGWEAASSTRELYGATKLFVIATNMNRPDSMHGQV